MAVLKKVICAIAACLAAMVLLVAPLQTKAFDFGDFANDGGWDDGGWDDGGWDNDWDDDNDYGSGGSGGGLTLKQLLYVLPSLATPAAIIVVIVLMLSPSKKNDKKALLAELEQKAASLNNMQSYLMLDPQFNEQLFCEQVAELYVAFQLAWQNKDLEPVRPFLTAGAYPSFVEKLTPYIQNRQTNHVENIRFRGVRSLGWHQENGLDVITVLVETSIVDYVTSDKNGKLLRGSKKDTQQMTYLWYLARPTGYATMPAFNWALQGIRKMAQETVKG